MISDATALGLIVVFTVIFFDLVMQSAGLGI